MFQGHTELALPLVWAAWESWLLGCESGRVVPVPHWSCSGVGGEEILPPSLPAVRKRADSAPLPGSCGRADPGGVGAGELASLGECRRAALPFTSGSI